MIDFLPSRAVALSIVGFDIHWYGLLYLLGFALAAVLLPTLQKYRGLSLDRDTWMSLLSWSVIGVIVGGRLGYVLFYESAYFMSHPAEIIAVWKGGMSFHGGLLGVVIVIGLFCRARKISLWAIGDTIVVPVAIGLALGRLGNFINQELYGTVTALPWGMAFPGADGLRHPLQLYGIAKDLLIAGFCFWHLQATRMKSVGKTGALFLILYGIGRFLLEFIREQQYASTDFLWISLTRGQLLTLPLFITGVIVWTFLTRRARR